MDRHLQIHLFKTCRTTVVAISTTMFAMLVGVAGPVNANIWRASIVGGPFPTNPIKPSPMESCAYVVEVLAEFYYHPDWRRYGPEVTDPYPDIPTKLLCSYTQERISDGRKSYPSMSLNRVGSCPTNTTFNPEADACEEIPDQCTLENPVGIGGNKVQQEIDYIDPSGLLTFKRFFSGINAKSIYSNYDALWEHSFERKLLVTNYSTYHNATLNMPDGRYYVFVADGQGGWTNDVSPKVSL